MASFEVNPGAVESPNTTSQRSDWTNIQNMLDIDSNFAQTTSTVPDDVAAETIFWSNFSFPEINPLWQLDSIEMRFDNGYAAAPVGYNGNTNWTNSSGNIVNSRSIPFSSSPGGSPIQDFVGPDDWSIPSEDFVWSTFLDSEFTVNVTPITSGSGNGILRVWGIRLKFFYTDNSTTAALRKIGSGASRVIETNEGFANVIQLASGFDSRSTGNLVLNGIPITLYEDGFGNMIPAVYDISEGGFDTPTASTDTYVRDGIRYSYLKSGDYNIFRASIGAEQSMVPASNTVWRGVPISISPSGDLMGKKVTGGITDTRLLHFGGVPLTAVKVEEDWALAIGSL